MSNGVLEAERAFIGKATANSEERNGVLLLLKEAESLGVALLVSAPDTDSVLDLIDLEVTLTLNIGLGVITIESQSSSQACGSLDSSHCKTAQRCKKLSKVCSSQRLIRGLRGR